MVQKVRLTLDLLEGRALPAVAIPAPPVVLVPTTPAVTVVAPVAPSAPTAPVATAPASQHALAGSGQGTYISTLKVSSTPSGFHFTGKANLAKLGAVDVYAHLYSVGFKTRGTARGDVTLSTRTGEIKLQLTGPIQTRLSPLPQWFSYKVVSATGSFRGTTGSGTLRIVRTLDAEPVKNGIRYFETGTFKLTI